MNIFSLWKSILILPFNFYSLTPSLFVRICKLWKTTSRDKVVSSMLFGTFKGNASTRYGIENENIAKEQLEKVFEKDILPSGLIIDTNQPFLIVSPDGFVEFDVLVEIKCPASAKDFIPEDAIKNKKN